MIWRRSPRPQHRPSPFGHVIRTHARSFALAARFLEPRPRHATEVLYAFFRTVDDLVDERPPDADVGQIRAELAGWDRLLADPFAALVAPNPLARALAGTMLDHGIPPAYPRALLRGLADDLDGRPIRTFDDLERYCFRVAGTVGLAMCHVLGATSPRALAAASALGIAMQLTNVLRDVAEDLGQGRLYLPADELPRFPGAAESLRRRQPSQALGSLLRSQVERARRYYGAGAAGLAELPGEVRYPTALALCLYGEILCQLERQRYNVFGGRASVSRPRKLLLAGQLAATMALGRPPCPAVLDPLSVLGRAAREELAAVGAPIFESEADVSTPFVIAS